MSSASVILIAVLTCIAIGLVATVFIVMNRNKEKEETLVKEMVDRDDKYKAIVNIRGSGLKINGSDVIGGNPEDGYLVKLWPGEHSIEGSYSVMGITGCNVVKYQTKKVRSIVQLQANHNYTLELYLYSANDRQHFYPEEELNAVFEQEVALVGYDLKAYIICYQVKSFAKHKEKPIEKIPTKGSQSKGSQSKGSATKSSSKNNTSKNSKSKNKKSKK